MSAGQLGLGNNTFYTICGTFLFLEKPDAQCNLGHMSYLFNMWTKEEVQELTTKEVIEKCLGLFEIKAHYEHQILDPPDELLADLQLFKQEIQTHFEFIENILNSITAQFMVNIASSIASRK